MPPGTTTNTFKAGDTASGVAQANGLSPEQFLSYNPDLAATGLPNDYQGLTGLVKEGQSYNLGPANNLVVSGKPAATDFANTSNDLATMLAGLNNTSTGQENNPTLENTNDAYTQMLDKLSATSSAATKALIGSIQASRSNQANTLDTTYENYKKGLQLLGIQHNDAASTPDLLMGHITQAENEHTQKLQSLDVETNKALIDAEKAQQEGDLATLKEKMDHVKDLKQQKDDYLKNIADNLGYQKTIASDEAAQYYDALQKLDPADQEAFLQAVSKKYGIPLESLTTAVANEKISRDKESLATEQAQANLANTKATTAKKTSTDGSSDKNYTATDIPDSVLSPLTDDLKNSQATLDDLISLYPEVSTSYLTSLYKTYHPTSNGS